MKFQGKHFMWTEFSRRWTLWSWNYIEIAFGFPCFLGKFWKPFRTIISQKTYNRLLLSCPISQSRATGKSLHIWQYMHARKYLPAIFQKKCKKRAKKGRIFKNLGKNVQNSKIFLKKGRWLCAIIARKKLLE